MDGREDGRITIRTMAVEDCGQVADLQAACFSAPWSLESIRAMTREAGYVSLVAESEGRPVGYVGYRAVLDEADITNVAVLEDYRGRGLAFSMIEALLEKARKEGIRKMFLEVRVSNDPAIHVYEKAGFRRDGIRRSYYVRPREDALIMSCDLVKKM